MHSFSGLAACLTAFLAVTSALKFSSPASGSAIDPTQPIIISWSVSYTDPSVFDLKLSKSGTDITLGTGIVTYSGTYTVPAGTIQKSDSGYTLAAFGNGITLGQVTGLSLGGESGQTSTGAEETLISTQTVVPTPAASGTSGATDTTDSGVLTASIDSVGATTLTGTATGSQVLASIAQTGTSFVTSTTSRAGSSSSAASPTAGSTNTASGQRRLAGELVLGAAGVLAGVVAILA